MPKIIALPALVAAGCLLLASGAGAQVVVPEGQDFYATPISKDGIALMGQSRIVTAAPAKMSMRRKIMRHKTMTRKMMKRM